MNSELNLEMNIELTVIEDLGIKLYGQLPPVLSEIISNAWDADATRVDVTLPQGDISDLSEIIIKDNGIGMSPVQIQNNYLRIGRKRRIDEDKDTTPNGRKVIGRKGIGKLSIFGVADTVEIETISDHKLTSFRMNIQDILKQAQENKKYKPTVLENEKESDEKQGTTVKLYLLKRKTRMDEESVRRNISRNFSIIGDEFKVFVNNKLISKADKHNKNNMEKNWDYDNAIISEDNPNWKISGWIGTSNKPLDEQERGIVIMARGKLLQAPTTFESKVGEKYLYSYIVGELNAEFLDEEEDLISTNRQSLVWETPEGSVLKEWGQSQLKTISKEWEEFRRENKEKTIREDPEFKKWLANLPKPDSTLANKMIKTITSSEYLDDDRRKELAGFMMTSFNQQIFRDLIVEFENDPNVSALFEVFKKWDLIEAHEIYILFTGRMQAIEQLEKHIDKNSKEIPTMHEFFQKWPWILDLTWTQYNHEVRYSKLLRENFPDEELEESDRRIDFISIGTGDTINVIELKRPGHSINPKDIDQLLDYVGFIEEHLGTDSERGYNQVCGYLIAGKIQTDRVTRKKMKSLVNDRLYVRTYEDLSTVSRRLYSDFTEKLKKLDESR